MKTNLLSLVFATIFITSCTSEDFMSDQDSDYLKNCPNNEIRYTTKNGHKLEKDFSQSFGTEYIKCVEHAYENGYGYLRFVSDVTRIPQKAFSNCTSLVEISLPASIVSIESNAFSGCTSLAEINLPANV